MIEVSYAAEIGYTGISFTYFIYRISKISQIFIFFINYIRFESAVKAFCRRAPELYLESARKLCSLRCLLYLILNGFYALASYRMPENLYFSIIRDTACLASSDHAYQAVRASYEPIIIYHFVLFKLAC